MKLAEYYKKIKICTLCNLEYGCDTKLDNGYCPRCRAKLYCESKGYKMRKYT